MEFKKLKIGMEIYHFYEYGAFEGFSMRKAIIDNFDENYINYCVGVCCKNLVGTGREHYKYDTALKIEDVYFSYESIKKALKIKLDKVLNQEVQDGN